ncbi:hypothetical protein MNBD_GAMMA11-740 [hydrothermal vent metagenome]|uniref:NAD-dependent epimerase/dehydratase domain-containing protein n=1 Tax=hydrothermal vent metagenome TaxID=652676 RepID=A0A3B0XEP2_9ZZZZ
MRKGDLRDTDYLDRALTGVDIICHAAGWSSFENTARKTSPPCLEPTIDLINRAIEWRISRFVNLSSLFVAPFSERNNADIKGKPRRYWPMINSTIAVEDYLRGYKSRCQFVNLRVGLYSGKRLNMGLLPLLLARSEHTALPFIQGPLGYLPLVDGQDIGQAFARAALAPLDAAYTSLNISGPETPSQTEAMRFLKEQTGQSPLSTGLPAMLAGPVLWLRGQLQKQGKQPLFTAAMLNMLKSPTIDNQPASRLLGYDPEISWQASLLDTLEYYKNQPLNKDLSQTVRALNIS